MNTVREYRMPLLIGAGALVVAILIWVAVVAPQNSKLSHLQQQQSQLTSQQATLEAKLSSLKSEKQRLSSNCAELQKISAQIPSVQNTTDVDAEESSFEANVDQLAGSTGVALTNFSGFNPAGATGASGAGGGSTTATTAPAHAAGTPTTPADVTAVPTTLTVTGNYGQVSAFINGLEKFPRLFVITNFLLSSGTSAGTSGSTGTGSGGSSGAGGSTGTPLWTGGKPTPASAGPYSVGLTGSIFYTSAPNALEACSKATASLK